MEEVEDTYTHMYTKKEGHRKREREITRGREVGQRGQTVSAERCSVESGD